MAKAPEVCKFGMSPPYSMKYPCALGATCIMHDTCREFCIGLALHLDGIAINNDDGVMVMTRVTLK
jgi:hypothetical protein